MLQTQTRASRPHFSRAFSNQLALVSLRGEGRELWATWTIKSKHLFREVFRAQSVSRARRSEGSFSNWPSLTVGLLTHIQLTAPGQNPILHSRTQPAMRECPRCE